MSSDAQAQNILNHRLEYQRKANQRLRNLRSKNPDRVIAQKLYDAAVEIYVVLGMGEENRTKYNKAFTKRAYRNFHEATRLAVEQGFSHNKRLKPEHLTLEACRRNAPPPVQSPGKRKGKVKKS